MCDILRGKSVERVATVYVVAFAYAWSRCSPTSASHCDSCASCYFILKLNRDLTFTRCFTVIIWQFSVRNLVLINTHIILVWEHSLGKDVGITVLLRSHTCNVLRFFLCEMIQLPLGWQILEMEFRDFRLFRWRWSRTRSLDAMSMWPMRQFIITI